MNINFSNLDFSNLKKIARLSLRIIILIAIILYYLNYRNNQCIINQNCQPFFLSHAIRPFKELGNIYLVYYKIDNDLPNIDMFLDKEFDAKIGEEILTFNNPEDKKITIETFTNYNVYNSNTLVFNDLDIINNNKMIIKKFKIANNSDKYVKVKTKMQMDPINSNVTIYNCFCGAKIELEPFQTKDLYVYLNVKNISKNDLSSTIKIALSL